jgi:hypothetical protein
LWLRVVRGVLLEVEVLVDLGLVQVYRYQQVLLIQLPWVLAVVALEIQITELLVQILYLALLLLMVVVAADLTEEMGQTGGLAEVLDIPVLGQQQAVVVTPHLLHPLKVITVELMVGLADLHTPLEVAAVLLLLVILRHQTLLRVAAVMAPHLPFLEHQRPTLAAVAVAFFLLAVLLDRVAQVEVALGVGLQMEAPEPLIQAVVGVVLEVVTQAEQAVQVSSSLNTSPNLITKSSNHQAHGLHLLGLLRSST